MRLNTRRRPTGFSSECRLNCPNCTAPLILCPHSVGNYTVQSVLIRPETRANQPTDDQTPCEMNESHGSVSDHRGRRSKSRTEFQVYVCIDELLSPPLLIRSPHDTSLYWAMERRQWRLHLISVVFADAPLMHS